MCLESTHLAIKKRVKLYKYKHTLRYDGWIVHARLFWDDKLLQFSLILKCSINWKHLQIFIMILLMIL